MISTARGPVALEPGPERVVVFDIAALDTLDALGVKSVGVPQKLFVSYLDHVSAEAEPVGTIFEPDLEAVAALEPDLIVIGGRSGPRYDALAAIAPVIDMTIGDDTLFEDARARIHAYGALFDRGPQAAELAAALDAEIAAARAAPEGRGDALILMTNGPKISAYGPGSRFGWLHAALGLSAAVDTPERSTQKMPFSTRRSSTRGTPRGLFGNSGSITRHSKSVRSYRLMPTLNQSCSAKESARHLRVVDGVPDQSLTRCLAYIIWRVQIVEKIARDEAFEKIGVALSTLNDRICRVRCRT
jgi:hypothetical protein